MTAVERAVLIVDDDELSREVLGLLLEGEGYAVRSAESGQAALDLLRDDASVSHAVLADVQMPGLSGTELAAALRNACGSQTRLIAMSGSQPQHESIAGYDGFLLKPFAMEEFAKLLSLSAPATPPGDEGRDETQPVASEAAPDNPVLDETVYASFARSLPPRQLGELYGACLADAAKQLRALEQAASAGDDAAFRRQAHAIKGSLGMLGARELEQSCSAMEQAGLAGSGDDVATLQQFAAGIERLRRMLVARGLRIAE